jgi:hypothetical protein
MAGTMMESRRCVKRIARLFITAVKRIFTGWRHLSVTKTTAPVPPMRKLFPFEVPVPPVIMPLAAAFLALAAAFGQVRAEPVRSFVIAAEDGYGISECVASRQACGRVVADAWCEGHGFGKASAYGSADDVTGSVAVAQMSAPPRGSVIITCGD